MFDKGTAVEQNIKQHEKFSLRESEISTTQCVFEAINASKPQANILGKIAGSYKRVQKVFLATDKIFSSKINHFV